MRVDRDGALREAADSIGGDTRARFLRKGALIGGGLLAGAIPLAVATGQGAPPKSDVEILNFALTLEYLEAAFYQEANASGVLTGDLATFSSVVGAHEDAHVVALQKALGSAAVKKPTFDFKGTTENPSTFLRTARVLEDTGVAAYAGQGPRIKTKAIVAAALSIHSVEARHAAALNTLVGKTIVPDGAFAKPASKEDVLKQVQPFIAA